MSDELTWWMNNQFSLTIIAVVIVLHYLPMLQKTSTISEKKPSFTSLNYTHMIFHSNICFNCRKYQGSHHTNTGEQKPSMKGFSEQTPETMGTMILHQLLGSLLSSSYPTEMA